MLSMHLLKILVTLIALNCDSVQSLFRTINQCQRRHTKFSSYSSHISTQLGKSSRLSKLFLSEVGVEGDKEKSLWKERVEYVDLSAVKESSPKSRPLPLFLLGGAFYPQGSTYLHVFEMKYRTMMYDIGQSDDMFGYLHTDPMSGEIASVGTLCKVTSRELLDDGRQYITLQGTGRFRVNKILKTLPYVLGEIEPIDGDDMVDETEAHKLEMETYNHLKYYMRLLKSFEKNSEMTVSQATKQNRPTAMKNKGNVGMLAGDKKMDELKAESLRRTAFSFSLANMIHLTEPVQSQLMLQTTSIMKRLKVEKDILAQASELVSQQLIKQGSLTEERRAELKALSFDDDAEDDILPADAVKVEEIEEKDEWDLSNIV